MKKNIMLFDIFTQQGDLYETVKIDGIDEEDCAEQLNLYLATKQDCYAFEHKQAEKDFDEDDEVTGGYRWSDWGDYTPAVSQLD